MHEVIRSQDVGPEWYHKWGKHKMNFLCESADSRQGDLMMTRCPVVVEDEPVVENCENDGWDEMDKPVQ